MTPQELVNKIDYEGGIYEAVCGYGLGLKDLTKATRDQRIAWEGVVEAGAKLRKAADEFHRLFPDVCEEDD